jgi:hypothetical protein
MNLVQLLPQRRHPVSCRSGFHRPLPIWLVCRLTRIDAVIAITPHRDCPHPHILLLSAICPSGLRHSVGYAQRPTRKRAPFLGPHSQKRLSGRSQERRCKGPIRYTVRLKEGRKQRVKVNSRRPLSLPCKGALAAPNGRLPAGRRAIFTKDCRD